MNCNDAYELLLEADPADLRAQGDTPIAAHLRSCDRCAKHAASILDAQAHLAHQLSDRRASIAVEPAIAAAAAEAQRRQNRRRLARRATPVLAAAALATILIATRDGRSPAVEQTRSPTPEMATPTVAQTASGQNLVVYETANPNIVIVWLY